MDYGQIQEGKDAMWLRKILKTLIFVCWVSASKHVFAHSVFVYTGVSVPYGYNNGLNAYYNSWGAYGYRDISDPTTFVSRVEFDVATTWDKRNLTIQGGIPGVPNGELWTGYSYNAGANSDNPTKATPVDIIWNLDLTLSNGGALIVVPSSTFSINGRLVMGNTNTILTVYGNLNTNYITFTNGTINGSGTWNNSNQMQQNDNSICNLVLNNTGTFFVNNGFTFTKNTTAFTNYWNISTSAGSTYSGDAPLLQYSTGYQGFVNAGTLTGTGTTVVGDGSSNTGSLQNTTGTFNRSGALTVNSNGNVVISGGTFTFPATNTISGNVYLSSNPTINGTIGSGTVASNPGTLNFGYNNLNIVNGSFGSGSSSGTTYNNTITIGNIVVTNGSSVTLSGTVTNNKTLSVPSGNTLTVSGNYVGAGCAVTNGGTLTAGSSFDCASINNSGTFIKSGAGTVLTTSGTFTNSNIVSLLSGSFEPTNFSNSGALSTSGAGNSEYGPVTATNTGTITFGSTGTNLIGNGGGHTTTTTNNNNAGNTAGGSITISQPTTIQATGALVNNGSLTSISINAATTNSGAITNTLGTLTVSAALTGNNSTTSITNSSTMNVSANISGTGTFTNNSTGNIAQTAGTINITNFANAGTYTATGTAIVSSSNFTNSGSSANATFNSGTTFSGTASNSKTMTFNEGSILSGTYTGQNGSTLYLNSTSTGVNIAGSTIQGVVGSVSSQLVINNGTSGTQTINTSISNIYSILVSGGTAAISSAITGNNIFQINTGCTANVSAGLTGTGFINNSGTLNLTGAAAISSYPNIFVYSGSTTTFNTGALFTLTGTKITGNASTRVGTLTITGNTNLSTDANITNLNSITVDSGSTLTMRDGCSVTNFNSFVINGTLTLQNGAAFTVSPGDNVTGTGSISNSGYFTINGANFTLGGGTSSFTNTSTGIFYISGTPTVKFNGGGTFTNNGTIFVSFSASNSLPFIDASQSNVSLSNGAIVVGYQHNYISAGNYTLLTANMPLNSTNVGTIISPQPTRYVSSFTLTTSGNNLDITVVRNGYQNHALTARAVEIGAFMEQIGANKPNQADLNLLNGLESTSTDEALTAALLSLIPPDSAPLQTMYMIGECLRPVELRLPALRRTMLAAAGENDVYNRHGVWIRPFSSSGNQHNKGELIGYKARTNGFALGIDTKALYWLTIGAAASISKSKVTEQNNSLTFTDISTYQAMIYGTCKFPKDSYLDWIVAVGNNNYNGTRNVTLPGFAVNAVSQYSGQQFTAKTIASKEFIYKGYLLVTPEASAQYSFLRTLGYTENGAGAFNNVVQPNNMNLLQFGVLADFSVPMEDAKYTSVPAVHAGLYVDAIGGVQDTNTMFISGGPIISSQVSQSRLMWRLGASLTVAVTDKIEVMFNYDYEGRRGYTGNEAFLNIRYIF